MKKTLLFILAGLLVIGVSLIAFIKFNTGGAAEFTDNYLRPILGNKIVGLLEKTYFNATDKVQQLTDKTGTSHFPELSGGSLSQVKIEKDWRNYPLKNYSDKEVMSYMVVKPDPDRPFAYVTLLKMNMANFNLGIVAGVKQPGGPIGNSGPGKIPTDIVDNNKLVAAFDGGFQYRDGEYGMVVGDKTYLPLKNEVGTIVGYKDGSLKIVNYIGQDLGNDVVFIRQNCPSLLDNGNIYILDEKNKHLWGRTFNSDIFTWRSGIGLTKEGDLIYAVGNNLSPFSLATALKAGGAENAIQLDINPFWVRFNIFESIGDGKYNTHTLTKDLKDGSKAYLTGYDKDFFYLYQK